MRDDTVRASSLVVGLLVGAVLIRWLSGQTYLALMAVIALAVALWRFFLPVEFELNERGIDQRVFGRRRHVPWQAVQRYEVCSSGVLLLPDEDRSPMAPFRGLYLPWSDRRSEVLALVGHYLEWPQDPVQH